jgi:hypothetical protein
MDFAPFMMRLSYKILRHPIKSQSFSQEDNTKTEKKDG